MFCSPLKNNYNQNKDKVWRFEIFGKNLRWSLARSITKLYQGNFGARNDRTNIKKCLYKTSGIVFLTFFSSFRKLNSF
jgi:hypothetical protein